MPLALVTGAGIRVGHAIATALAEHGFDLLLHANRSRAGADELAARLNAGERTARVVGADLSSQTGVDALVAAVGDQPLELLVNNAGLFERLDFAEVTREQYRRMMAVNLEAPFFLTQALLPALRRSANPHVVNVVDIGGERPVSHYSHYSVSKAGLHMLTRALAVELGPEVRVNGVSPGTVAMPEGFPEAARESLRKRTPLKREGKPSDIADAILYLHRQRFTTGQVLAVDGGRGVAL